MFSKSRSSKFSWPRFQYYRGKLGLLIGGSVALAVIVKPNKSVKGTRRPLAVLKFSFL